MDKTTQIDFHRDAADSHHELEDVFSKLAANCKEAGFERAAGYLERISSHHANLGGLHTTHAKALSITGTDKSAKLGFSKAIQKAPVSSDDFPWVGL
jgi:hypothetical protein